MNVQLKQTGLALGAGKKYQVSFKIKSTEARDVLSGLQNATKYNGYKEETIHLVKDTEKTVVYNVTMPSYDDDVALYISMGLIGTETPGSVITISDLSLIEVVE